jgi:hypothetical protein
MDGLHCGDACGHKTPFWISKLLTDNWFTTSEIPAKIEGVAFGPDVKEHKTIHTL